MLIVIEPRAFGFEVEYIIRNKYMCKKGIINLLNMPELIVFFNNLL